MAISSSRRVKAANKASPEKIASVAGLTGKVTLGTNEFTVRVDHGSTLASDDTIRDAIWALWEANMREMTVPSSFGWNPTEKKKELFHRHSRHILLLREDANPQAGEKDPEIIAFAHFRFEHEDDEDLLYCYELQVADAFRRRGIGRFIVEKLAMIGKHWRMQKIMLTVLKENESARHMYAKLGFILDPCSPDDECELEGQENTTEEDRPHIDYEILSKDL
ncbi:acyl-CoA N-acyltransferase [Dichomitus squalens LYAD-421 SS1]|uniref:acyl-CoA N-acyltransferase n=1 Tax=Dichomitus squalens (strain LYAD-421) TaxID=732165 RepID=UPI000441512D|nr:acyl-CoA N-acyltransferase [Dichomitus squalens LYAD-421 SS1]EJF67018.1 acyl-CoA N-acyltransferase [Dichomitus squalens LYAD-421 SS1]